MPLFSIPKSIHVSRIQNRVTKIALKMLFKKSGNAPFIQVMGIEYPHGIGDRTRRNDRYSCPCIQKKVRTWRTGEHSQALFLHSLALAGTHSVIRFDKLGLGQE